MRRPTRVQVAEVSVPQSRKELERRTTSLNCWEKSYLKPILAEISFNECAIDF
jgi:hypothetical protein